jgi:hypothetical protein
MPNHAPFADRRLIANTRSGGGVDVSDLSGGLAIESVAQRSQPKAGKALQRPTGNSRFRRTMMMCNAAAMTAAPLALQGSDSSTQLERGRRLIRQAAAARVASRRQIDRSLRQARASRLWAREHQAQWRDAIALIVRQKLRAGRLPITFRLVRIFNGSDTGTRCAACNGELQTTQLVLEVPLTPGGPLLKLHSDCFMIWTNVRAAMWLKAS